MEQGELKFRAWDCFNGVMIYSYDFWNLSSYFSECERSIEGGNKLIQMQYTGLKGKNGKEIYDGDYVKTNSNRICEVRWHSSNNSASWDLHPLEFKNPAPSQNAIWRDIEVIGNIYENPELLK